MKKLLLVPDSFNWILNGDLHKAYLHMWKPTMLPKSYTASLCQSFLTPGLHEATATKLVAARLPGDFLKDTSNNSYINKTKSGRKVALLLY